MTELESEALIQGPNILPPDPIDHSEISKNFLVNKTDSMGRVHGIYVFDKDNQIPISVAEWLRYRSFTENSVGANHEGDKTRFKNVTEITENFLEDQGGRTLYVAVSQDNNRLYGASWIHTLQDNEFDMLLALTAKKYMNEKLGYEEFNLNEVSTFATREYGIIHERSISEMCVRIGSIAIANYFSDYNSDCKLVIGRYGEDDNLHTNFNSAGNNSELQGKFKVIDKKIGYIIMGVLRPDLQDLHPLYS